MLHLTQPYAPLVAVLADRAGMMISPKALGRDVTSDLPCAGPFKLIERVAQDRIVVDRFPGYWNASAIKLDRIVYQPIPDTTVRLVNLQARQLDMVERLGPTDVATVKRDPKLQLISQAALAYYSMSINLAAPDSPLKDARVRAALEAAIDRNALNQVVFDGQFIPSISSRHRAAGIGILIIRCRHAILPRRSRCCSRPGRNIRFSAC